MDSDENSSSGMLDGERGVQVCSRGDLDGNFSVLLQCSQDLMRIKLPCCQWVHSLVGIQMTSKKSGGDQK